MEEHQIYGKELGFKSDKVSDPLGRPDQGIYTTGKLKRLLGLAVITESCKYDCSESLLLILQ